MTHTYVTLDVPQEFFDLVKERMEAAGYDHAFHDHGDGNIRIDMHGIALVAEKPPLPTECFTGQLPREEELGGRTKQGEPRTARQFEVWTSEQLHTAVLVTKGRMPNKPILDGLTNTVEHGNVKDWVLDHSFEALDYESANARMYVWAMDQYVPAGEKAERTFALLAGVPVSEEDVNFFRRMTDDGSSTESDKSRESSSSQERS